jgi:hypothetical protein
MENEKELRSHTAKYQMKCSVSMQHTDKSLIFFSGVNLFLFVPKN